MENLSVIAKEISELEEEKQLLLREYFDISMFSSLSFAAAASRLRSAYWGRRKEEKSSLRSETVKEKLLVAKVTLSLLNLVTRFHWTVKSFQVPLQ